MSVQTALVTTFYLELIDLFTSRNKKNIERLALKPHQNAKLK